MYHFTSFVNIIPIHKICHQLCMTLNLVYDFLISAKYICGPCPSSGRSQRRSIRVKCYSVLSQLYCVHEAPEKQPGESDRKIWVLNSSLMKSGVWRGLERRGLWWLKTSVCITESVEVSFLGVSIVESVFMWFTLLPFAGAVCPVEMCRKILVLFWRVGYGRGLRGEICGYMDFSHIYYKLSVSIFRLVYWYVIVFLLDIFSFMCFGKMLRKCLFNSTRNVFPIFVCTCLL